VERKRDSKSLVPLRYTRVWNDGIFYLFRESWNRLKVIFPGFVIAARVAAIHGSASVIHQENSTLVEPWITGTSPVMTIVVGLVASLLSAELNLKLHLSPPESRCES
jgi:hypothetical protein